MVHFPVEWLLIHWIGLVTFDLQAIFKWMLLVSLKKNIETYIYIEDITCPHKVDTNFIFDLVLKLISHGLAALTPEKIKID